MTTKAILGTPNTLKFVGPGGKSIELKQDVDFVPCSFGGGGKISGDLVFASYGLDEHDFRDFKGIDVKGKVVIVMRRNPGQVDEEPQEGPAPGPPGRRRAQRRRPSHQAQQRHRRRRQCDHLPQRSVQRAKERQGRRVPRPPRQ